MPETATICRFGDSRRIWRQSPFSVTVVEFGDKLSPKTATVDCRRIRRQCGQSLTLSFSSVIMCEGEYIELCPGGSGFRPNEVTVILEGSPFSFVPFCTEFETQ